MSYLKALYETYETNAIRAGEIETKSIKGEELEFMLLPISHTTQTAHVEMTINIDGTLADARIIPKESTILPFTEESGGRAGKNYVPHVLHDKLMFVAGDFVKYTGQEDKSDTFDKYINQLRDWCESPYNHPHVQAIYQYVKKGTVIEDLVERGILHLGDSGKLLSKWTNKDVERPSIFSVLAGDQESALVRFNIHISEQVTESIWRDKEVFNAYTNYYETKLKEKDE